MNAAFKIALLTVASFILIPFQAVLLLFTKGKSAYFIPQLWHKIASLIFGLEIQIIGRPETKQVFFVGNHLSHFDIFILGSKIKASFVAKEDLAHWLVIGFLCRLQQTAFISRSSGQAGKVSNNIRNMLNAGKSIILFPEGTSTRGESVLDFKSSLFSLPIEYADKELKIQPFTIKLLEVDGVSTLSRELRDFYAWDRDNPIEIGAHIWNFAHKSGAKLQIIFHEALPITSSDDRKLLCQTIQNIVAKPLELAA